MEVSLEIITSNSSYYYESVSPSGVSRSIHFGKSHRVFQSKCCYRHQAALHFTSASSINLSGFSPKREKLENMSREEDRKMLYEVKLQ